MQIDRRYAEEKDLMKKLDVLSVTLRLFTNRLGRLKNRVFGIVERSIHENAYCTIIVEKLTSK